MDLSATTYIDPWGGVDSFASFESVSGTQFADTLSGDGGANVLRGLGGNDWIAGKGAGGDTLEGGGGDNELWGNAGADSLLGGDGDDILRSQGGADFLSGGAGSDQFVVFSSSATVTDTSGSGVDTVWSLAPFFTVPSFVEFGRLLADNASLSAGLTAATLVTYGENTSLFGGVQGDTLWGSGNADFLDGGFGNDVIRAGGGDDVIYGGAGDDLLVGGAGADSFALVAGEAQGYDRVFDFSRAEGDRILVEASAALDDFADFQRFEFGGNSWIVAPDGSRVDLYGVTGLTAADFVFV